MRQWGDLPDMSTLHVKSGAGLEEVAMRKFLKHGIVVLGVVACDVPNLEKQRLVCISHKVLVLTLGTICRWLQTL